MCMSDPAALLRDSRRHAGMSQRQLALRPSGVDESLIRRQLELSPSERLHGLEAMHTQARALALAGARSRGEHV